MSPVSIPDHCGTKRTSHSQCSDFPSFSSPGEKGKEKEELGKKKIDHEGALETERGGCKKKKSGTKRITPVIDTQVRRSERVRLGSAGFKYNGCTSKKCSSCNPPTLTNKVIKNLGVQFCSLDASVLEDEALCKKGEIKDAVVKKKSKAPKPSKETKESREEGGEEEDGPADH